MPIDNSIYFRQQLPDIAGSIQSGMKLGDMFRQRKQDQAVEDAYRNNINEKGEFSSQGRLLSDLTRAGAYKEAAAQKEAFGADAAAKLKAQRDRTDRLYQIASSAKDQNSYTSALKMAAAEGLDISQMPQQYDPGLMSQYERALLSAKERADMDWKMSEAARQQRNAEADQSIARMKIKSDTENSGVGFTAGQKKVDQEFAKDYNEFTDSKINQAQSSIQKLEAIRDALVAEGDGLLADGGGRAEFLPDSLRSRNAIQWRDGAKNAANAGLKSIFGGNLSDGERKAAAEEFYNDKLGNKENAEILSTKIAEMRENLRNQIAKVKHFERNGTLAGFKANTGGAQSTVDQVSLDDLLAEKQRRQKSALITPRGGQ